jgi:hypothetical protein
MQFGIERLLADLKALGHHDAEKATGSDGNPFAVIRSFRIPLGRFAGHVIDLGLPAPPNFPQGVGASIHVRATPQLLPDGRVPDVRNVTASPLGAEWRYWSHNFGWSGERSTRELMAQVNRIFLDA